jgi:HK97 family phage prohead protease
MRFYAPIAKVDGEQRMVWGYASTAAVDDQGETITRDALAAALDEYMKFANIREMHQMSAVGVAEEAAVDDKGLYLGARIVDSRAWDKVTGGVYKGFSIGGRVRSRDPHDRTVITGMNLTEISLVDRPANPEAVFDCWKAEGGETAERQAAFDHIHGRLVALMGGDCRGAAKAVDHLKIAHDAVCRAGARCDQFSDDAPGDAPAEANVGKAARADDLMKAFAAEFMPRLDALAKRVEEIAAAPLPPRTAARAPVGITKAEDSGHASASPDDVVEALARMSDEQRTLALIKAAHANPIRPFGRT